MGGPWAVYGRRPARSQTRFSKKNAKKRYVQALAIACKAILAVNLGGKRASYQIVPAVFTTIKLIALRVKTLYLYFAYISVFYEY